MRIVPLDDRTSGYSGGGGLSPCCNCATTLIIKPSLPNAGPMLLNAFKNDITCILSVYNSNASIKVS